MVDKGNCSITVCNGAHEVNCNVDVAGFCSVVRC